VVICELVFWKGRTGFLKKLVKCIARNIDVWTHELVASKCRQLNKIPTSLKTYLV